VGNAPLLTVLRAARVPCVVSVDGMEWRRAKWGAAAKAYMRLCERLAASLADELIVDSRVVSDYYASRYGRPGEYAPYGTFTDPPRGPAPLGRLGLRPKGYVLFVGRLTPEKNVHQLLAAFKSVDTDLQLAVVGDDPFSRDYVASLKRTRDPRVRFLGYVYGDDALHLFANAYLYATASGLEGTSPALLTAMGQGCCALVNGIAENRETLGEAGRAYAENDVADLRRQLQFLLDRPDVVAHYGRQARLRVEQVYNWDAVTDTLEAVYQRVAA
jgi:glycosyltransferase involved in cell wall biosynthesis